MCDKLLTNLGKGYLGILLDKDCPLTNESKAETERRFLKMGKKKNGNWELYGNKYKFKKVIRWQLTSL